MDNLDLPWILSSFLTDLAQIKQVIALLSSLECIVNQSD